ncbi:MAG: HAD-IA family hydrolase [Chloroflexota bacterium]
MPAIREYWYRVSAECMQLRNGTVKTLEAIGACGYKLGMITNGKTVVQNATLDAVNIRAFFPVIVISEASGVRKPDPTIFQIALSQMEVQAENAVYIGDNPDADIQGARNAGLKTIWIGQDWTYDLPEPDHQITQMSDLHRILLNDLCAG